MENRKYLSSEDFPLNGFFLLQGAKAQFSNDARLNASFLTSFFGSCDVLRGSIQKHD